ncbi:uncharacterized protein LOC142173629 [Nicotiana tabacum]|uniref:Uncharacterized protein LOC142173629 n=1 Tax=Nicotiana tabacum TaxID=4097 RepID=A0AC58TDQ2_TOBAC
MVKNHFETMIKVIRFDNGTEFFNSQCGTLLHNFGIIHQSICPYTPQQNDVVEMNPRCGKGLKVSGKLVKGDKFAQMANASVLLDFSETQKGYILLDLSSNMFFVSRDVVFKEILFSFRQKSYPEMVQVPALAETEEHPFFEVEHEQDDICEELGHEQGVEDAELEQDLDQVPTTKTSIHVVDGRRKTTRESKQPIWMKYYVTHPPKAYCLYPISDYLSYANTSVKYQCYLAKFSSLVEPQTFK